MKTMTLYLEMPNLTFLFTTTSENSPQLFNGNKLNREALEDKKVEIFGQRPLLTTRAIDKIPSISELLKQGRYMRNKYDRRGT